MANNLSRIFFGFVRLCDPVSDECRSRKEKNASDDDAELDVHDQHRVRADRLTEQKRESFCSNRTITNYRKKTTLYELGQYGFKLYIFIYNSEK